MLRKILLVFALAVACAPSLLAQNYARMLSGVNYQTGTTYTFVAADVTRVTVFSNASPVTATLPSGQALFGAGSIFSVSNNGAGAVTIICSSCTINGLTNLTLAQNQGADIYGDGTNYVALLGAGAGGGGSLPSASSRGQLPAAAGPGTTYAAQSKPVIDARDIGVDCTGVTNSDSALAFLATTNSITSSQLLFPQGCIVHVQNTILVKNQASFSILGASRTGAANKGVVIKCVSGGTCTGGPVIDMEYVDAFEVGNLTIDANGLASSSLNIDKTGGGQVYNTTDGNIHDMAFHVGASGGATQGWTGVQFSAVSTQNVEDMRVKDSSFFCNARPNNYAQFGVLIGFSQNAKNEVIRHNNFTNCFVAVWKEQGSVIIEENEFSGSGGASASGTGSDIRIDGNADVDVIRNNLDENGTQFFNCSNDAPNGGCNTPFAIVISGNHFSPAGSENTSKYWINASNSPGAMEIANNGWDSDSGMANVIGSGHPIVRPLHTQGNLFPNLTFTPWWLNGAGEANGCCAKSEEFGILIGPRIFAGPQVGQSFPSATTVWRYYNTNTSFDDFAAQNNGASFLLKHSGGPSGAFVNLDASLPSLTLAQIGADNAPAIANAGTPGSTSYSYAVVAYVGSNNCVGGTHGPGSPATTTTTGNATLNTSNFNLIQFGIVQGASEYAIYRTASSGTPASTGQIGCFTAIQTIGANYALGAGYPSNQVLTNSNYQFNDTGLAGDSSSLPSTNTTGGVTLAPITFANLPSAASSTGKMFRVSDSTAVASEGQVCAGASTHTALAFSDGTQWKCF